MTTEADPEIEKLLSDYADLVVLSTLRSTEAHEL